ncbi:c-di-GMP-binding flagellar brake protein YcgR, contains PilZNR and PilZ domains [Evansella caseinilytica]|uniref:C-di-GMP-binding flagellar brake protein YcgR, contains PilZNR and PilZ domains n=1 Tax=Evansella caseinilytica TaxID=1503961 RepID=A0A1H3NC79_9BACI|nr:c-di-GMP-binding flagellar brake protein YcgR, contains PilZNR and PilZ domains [Evansella caseinilytica]
MIKASTTLYLELSDSAENKNRYRSKLLDFDDQRFYIDYPVEQVTNKPHFFLPGTQFRVWYLGEDSAIYLFNSEVLGKVERKLPMLVLSDPGFDQYIRVQRREYVRIDAAVDTAVHPMKQEFEPFTSVTLDISGGGAAVLLPNNHPLEPEMHVFLWLSLSYQTGEILAVKVKARLVRVLEEKGITKGSFQFVDISEQERQKIVRFCFEKQLAIRKKEMNL